MTYQPILEKYCNRHKKKLVQHEYFETLADTYGVTNARAQKMASQVAPKENQ